MQTAGAIRVLRVITRLNIGGPSIQAIALSDRLSARGFQTRLVHGELGAGEGDMGYLLAPAVRAHYLASLRRPVAPLHDLVAFARLLDIMRDFRPHIVHTHMAKAGTVARAAAAVFNRTAGRNERARVVHTYHGHVLEGYFSPPATRVFIGIERQLARATDRIVATRDPTAVFLIAGDGELRSELEAAAARLGVAECTRFLGWRRDLENVYGASDVFLLTSRNEGTPVALIDSLSAVAPGVSTNVGGVTDVLDTEAVGLLAPFGDAVALSDHIVSLLGDPVRRRAMGEHGRAAVLSRFGLDRLVDDVERLYRELLS